MWTCDASFDDCDGSKSTLGYCLFLGTGLITWRSTKSACVALSSCESEYYAACLLTKDIMWARSLLEELGFFMQEPTPLFIDNNGAEAIIYNPKHHQRTKHIKRQYNFIKESRINGEILPVHVDDPNQVADILTKPLAKGKFRKMRQFMLNLCTRERKDRFKSYEDLALQKKRDLEKAKAVRTKMDLSSVVDDHFTWSQPNFDGFPYFEMAEWDARRLGIW